MERSRPGSPLPLSDFGYHLPPERIAQEPLEPRDAARLLVLERESGIVHHSRVAELPRWLKKGDLIVANNTRVLPARLYGTKRETGGGVELLMLRRLTGDTWNALAKPARKLRSGVVIVVKPRREGQHEDLVLEVEEVKTDGEVVIRAPGLSAERLQTYGSIPLPPYINVTLEDDERYQTLHASRLGSAAAPTAGLHLTPQLRDALAEAGVGWAEVTLHVGLDTFRPVIEANVEDHRIHQEWYSVPAEILARIGQVRTAGGRIVALGTTSARTLETVGRMAAVPLENQQLAAEGMTDLFILPGHQWTMVDALITNFHLPKSTLLVMVSALAGREAVLKAYHEAIAMEYRFFSFGDAMLII